MRVAALFAFFKTVHAVRPLPVVIFYCALLIFFAKLMRESEKPRHLCVPLLHHLSTCSESSVCTYTLFATEIMILA